MTKYLKILLIVIGVLLALIVAGYFAIRSYLNPATVRKIAERVAEETLQRPVKFGTVGLHFGLKVGITVQDITIANSKGFAAEPVVEIEQATLNLKLLPLIQKKIIISGLDFVSPTVRIERSKEGTFNLVTLIPQEQEGTDWKLSLSKISIRNGTVLYQDNKDNTELRLQDLAQDISFRGNRVYVKGHSSIDVLKSALFPQTTFHVKNNVAYDTLKRLVQIDRLSLDHEAIYIQASGSIDKMDLISLNTELKISDLNKIKPFIPVKSRPAEMTGSIKANASILGSMKDPQVDGRCELHRVKIVPAGMLKGLERIDGSLSFDKNAIRNILMQGVFGNAKIKISGSITNMNAPTLAITTLVDGDLNDFEGLTQDMQGIKMKGPIRADVSLNGKSKNLTYTGSYAILNAEIDGIGIAKPVTNFNAKGTFAQDKANIETCSGHIGRSDFSFSGTVSRFNDPVIEINNRSNIIDLDELMPEKSETQAGVPVTIKGRVTIGTLTGMDMQYKNVQGYFSFEKGIIDLSKCSAEAFDGQVNLDMYYNSNNPEPYQISSRMTSVSAQKLLKRFLNVDNIEGTISGLADFTGKGLEVKEVLANMNASGNLALKNGVFNNFDFITKLLAWLGMKDQKNVSIKDFNVSYKIVNGRVTADNWALSSSYGNFLWNGTIGLNGTLNLMLTTTLNKQHSEIVKKHHGDWIFHIDSNGRAVIDLLITGTFTSPKFNLDKDKIKKRIQGKVKDKFEEKKKEVNKKIDEQKKNWEKKVEEEKKKWEKKLKGLLK